MALRQFDDASVIVVNQGWIFSYFDNLSVKGEQGENTLTKDNYLLKFLL
jgi:hypothetical protein